jgi:hypothetical protein
MPKLKRVSVKERTDKKTVVLGEFEKFIKDLIEKVHQDDEDRLLWRYKVTASNNQRLGHKTVVNEPYPGAPDIPLPETDKLIDKAKPNLVLSLWSSMKLCTVKPEQGTKEDPEMKMKCKRIEDAMNMILRTKMDLFNTLEMAADYAKTIGHAIFRVTEKWNKRIVNHKIDTEEYDEGVLKALRKAKAEEQRAFLAERYGFDVEDERDQDEMDKAIKQFKSGATTIEFDTVEFYSYPLIEAPNPTKVIVPPYTTDLCYAPRICYEYDISLTRFEQMMDENIFDKRDLDELIKLQSEGEESEYDLNERDAEGISGETNKLQDMFRLQEVETWHKPKKGAKAERWVFTFVKGIKDPKTACVKKHRYPYEFDGWNYERFDNERRSARHYASRGIPERIRGLQEMMERSINNALIRDEMNNTPSYQVQDTSDILRRNEYFAPGEMVPVKAINQEIAPLNGPNAVDLSSERLIQFMKGFTEEYIYSGGDQLFRNSTNAGGGKTLGEVREGINVTQKPLMLEVMRWNECMSKVFTKVYLILKERLSVSIFLPDGTEVTREDFQIPVEVRANGSLEVSDNEFAAQKASMRLQTIMNPAFLDFVSIEDKFNAFTDWLEKDGVKDPSQFSTNPSEIMNGQFEQMKAQLMQMQQQAQMLQKQIVDGAKEVASIQKKGRQAVTKAEGEMKAVSDTFVTGGYKPGMEEMEDDQEATDGTEARYTEGKEA